MQVGIPVAYSVCEVRQATHMIMIYFVNYSWVDTRWQ